ncbi:NAD-dependent epimerase/dehydratase family protein [Micromonospora sp. NPDC085948]|uniref:NAD-dependent epimerase/dehydratase family protein n=1 Tax=Micromonospora sp. NPDC085948 TaxID=3155293 RepID=UPI00343A2646
MKLLVLGGTGFVGRAIVDEARARRAHVTVFNRGHRRTPDGITALIGDRTTPDGLAALRTGTWDLVVDTWSGAPAAVRDVGTVLAGRIGHYTYISSRSVYTYPPAAHLAEDGPVVAGSPDSDGVDVDYAALKRGAEIAAQQAFDGEALLARAGLILGPYEDIGRLPYWLLRIARGGTVAAPGPRDLDLQYVDARDLAAFVLDGGAAGLAGPYNVVSPPGHTTTGDLLDTCVRATGSDATLRWIDPATIAAAGVTPWTQLPCWLPPGPEHAGMHRGDVSKALAAGLRCRPVRDTVIDTWAWLQTLNGPPYQRPDRPQAGLTAEAEAALLAAA